MKAERLFHVSETPGVRIFIPRPSPSKFEQIRDDVVFAISGRLLHNYLLPRECPRVTYYAKPETAPADVEKFFRDGTINFVIAIEENWVATIQQTVLYCYELPAASFTLLDDAAGYYISYEPVLPIAVKPIVNPLNEILKRADIELRLLPSLWNLADEVVSSGLNFSLIRMRNAKSRTE